MKTLLLLALFLTPSLARAELITFGFSGFASYLFDPNFFQFTGRYSFDSNAIGTTISDDFYSSEHSYETNGLTLNYLGNTQFFNDVTLFVRNQIEENRAIDQGGLDRYRLRTGESSSSFRLNLNMIACNANPLSSSALPLNIDFSQWGNCSDPDDFEFSFGVGDLHALGGLTSLARIPEPASWLLVGLGLIGLARVSRPFSANRQKTYPD